MGTKPKGKQASKREVNAKRTGRPRKEKPPHDGLWLKALLMRKGISQRELAKTLGMSPPSLNLVLSGKRTMNDKIAQLLANTAGMSLQAFLSRLQSPQKRKYAGESTFPFEGTEMEITGWIDGKLFVHDGKPKGPATAMGPVFEGRPRVLRFQTQGSPFESFDGGLAYFYPTGKIDPDAIGKAMSVVKMSLGGQLLRVVKKGYSAGRYNLFLPNGEAKEMDVELDSAAPVVWLRVG